MKVTSLRTLRPAANPNLLFVELATDDGLVGLGETFFGAAAVECVLHDLIAGSLLGTDPLVVAAADLPVSSGARTCTGAEMRAVSAVDIALWDLRSQAAGLSLSAFLGGTADRTRVRTYNTCAGPAYVQKKDELSPRNWGLGASGQQQYEDLDAFLHRADELALSLLEDGIMSMKIWPLDELAEARRGAWVAPAELDAALSPVRKIRDAVGDRIDIKMELHGLWSLPAACTIAGALEDFGISWIEDPVWVHDMRALAQLRSRTSIPVAAGETLAGRAVFTDMVQRRSVDTVILDIAWNGGITPSLEIGREVDAAGLKFALHDCSGPVVLAASTHVALSLPNVPEQESARGFYNTWYHDFVQAGPIVEDGFIAPPDGPGHGIVLLPDLATRPDVATRVTELR